MRLTRRLRLPRCLAFSCPKIELLVAEFDDESIRSDIRMRLLKQGWSHLA